MSVYTYDAMNILLKTYATKGAVNAINIYRTNYEGISGAYLENNKFFRSENYVILSVSKDGFKYES